MGLVFLFLIFPIGIAFVAAYFIALFAGKKLEKAGNTKFKLLKVLTFIFSFLIITIAILALIAYNIEIHR